MYCLTPNLSRVFQELLSVYLFVLGNIEFVLTMLGLCCSLEVARTSGLQSPISCWPLVDLCRILVGGSLLVPCSLPGPPVVNVFSPLWPGKAGWSLASQRWLEVNDLGRLVNRYGRRQWHPTPVLLPGKSHGRRSLVGCSPWGRKESDLTEWLHFHFSLSCIGEGNGNPLQCSCLENPRDGGACWAAVYGVAQSRTRLKWLSSSSRRQWQ